MRPTDSPPPPTLEDDLSDIVDIARRLAEALADDYYLTTTEAAEETGVTATHLVHLRRTGRGPAFHRFGHNCGRYRLSEVLAWRLSQ